jgi:Protein of unknown function (DUF3990)
MPKMPTNWTNQDLILYHGTLDIYVKSILKRILIGRGRTRTDFGQGFYTTTHEPQARSWAWLLSKRYPGTSPRIIQFDLGRDDLAKLQALWFVRGSSDADDYWSFILHCRRSNAVTRGHGRTNNGWYDIVIGPVTVSWWNRLTIHDSDQISFHTQKSARVLMASNPKELR